MKKLVSAFLIAALSCVMILPASAAALSDQELQEMYEQQAYDLERASSYFALRMVWASAGRNGEIEVGFEAGAPRVMNRLGATRIEIMRKSGDNWIPVETYKYTDSGMGYIYGKNETAYTEAVYFQGTVGKQYCAYITLKAEDDDGSESHLMATEIVTARK